MTSQPKDTPVEEPVAKELPVPSTSAGSPAGGSGATSPDVDALRQEIAALRKELPEIVESRVKSTKDKRFQKLEELLKSADDLQSKTRDVVRDVASEGGFSAPAPGKGEDEETSSLRALSAEHLKAIGVDASDAEYLALVSEWNGKIKNPQHWDLVLRAHVDRRKGKAAKQEAPVTQAAVAAPTKPTPDEGNEIARLSERLKYLQEHNPLKNKAERDEIRAKLAKLNPQREG